MTERNPGCSMCCREIENCICGPNYFSRKADQHWEMAGLARMDHDTKDEAHHIKKAREFDKLAKEGRA